MKRFSFLILCISVLVSSVFAGTLPETVGKANTPEVGKEAKAENPAPPSGGIQINGRDSNLGAEADYCRTNRDKYEDAYCRIRKASANKAP